MRRLWNRAAAVALVVVAANHLWHGREWWAGANVVLALYLYATTTETYADWWQRRDEARVMATARERGLDPVAVLALHEWMGENLTWRDTARLRWWTHRHPHPTPEQVATSPRPVRIVYDRASAFHRPPRDVI